MDFTNRGISSFLILALVFVGIFFLINMLPVILVIGAVAWGTSYIVKKVKNFNKNREPIFKNKNDEVEIVKDIFKEDLSDKNIIDVEYTEIK